MSIRSGMLVIAFLIFTFLLSCGGGDSSTNPENEVNWETETPSTYSLESSSSTVIEDSLTGLDFVLPEGGQGTLTVAKIKSGPEPDFDGEGFSLQYSGSERIQARVPKEGAYCVMLMGYGKSYGSRDERDEDDWRALAEVESSSEEAVFELVLDGSANAGDGFAYATDHQGFKYHWITKIPAGSSDAVKLSAIESQATEFINHILDSLPSSIKSNATSEVNGRLAPTYYADDNYYIGFTRRRLIGNSTTPMIGITANSGANTIAHEVGHYMHHVLIGDATYLQIENSAPDNHGLGDSHYMRQSITEDIAYFAQYFLLGHVNSADATEPGIMMPGKDPDLTDYPSLEGFGCCLLARLNSTNSKIRDMEFISNERDFPAVGASFKDLFGIIDKGATDIDELREDVKDYLVSTGQKDKYPVILERLGWRYNAKATIVNPDGDPVIGADVKCVAKVGSTEYFTRSENVITRGTGVTDYIEIFPDSSYLRVDYNGKSYDIPIYADPEGDTHVAVDLDTLVIDPFDLSRFTRFYINISVEGKLRTHYSYRDPTEHWTGVNFDEGTYLHGSFNGNTFTAVWDTALYANPVNSSGSATIVIDPQSRSLVSADAEFVQPASVTATKREYKVEIGSISTATLWDEYYIQFRIEGEQACQIIEDLQYRTYNEPDLNWYELLEYKCDENSVVEVTFNSF
ncbi:MAG: hypothetical protein GF404_07780 [candidate division Zixibacteria bacterium]|nr:hypothetical protein [candidate division Zixibacteria bacterium]